MAPHPVLLPGKSHGRRCLVGYRPWDREELDTTEQLHFHFSLSAFKKMDCVEYFLHFFVSCDLYLPIFYVNENYCVNSLPYIKLYSL